MGLRDTEEMLEAAKAQAVIDERLIAIQQDKLTAIREMCDVFARVENVGLPVERVRAILDGPDPAGQAGE